MFAGLNSTHKFNSYVSNKVDTGTNRETNITSNSSYFTTTQKSNISIPQFDKGFHNQPNFRFKDTCSHLNVRRYVELRNRSNNTTYSSNVANSDNKQVVSFLERLMQQMKIT